jgi:hypothetical protein
VDAGDDVVFQSKFRRGMGVRSIEDVVSKYLKDAGIWGASVRSLRHTFATHTVKSGTSVGVGAEGPGARQSEDDGRLRGACTGGDGSPAAGARPVRTRIR